LGRSCRRGIRSLRPYRDQDIWRKQEVLRRNLLRRPDVLISEREEGKRGGGEEARSGGGEE